MSAPEGNQFWKFRSTHGREKLFKSPDLMWEAACDYFEWCETNPIEAGKAKLNRPFTIHGMCIYLDCNTSYFKNFKKQIKEDDPLKEEFSSVIAKIEQIIYNQKFEGAAVGIFKENLIARDLGLIDKKDITTDGEKITPPGITFTDENTNDKNE